MAVSTEKAILRELRDLGDPAIAEHSQRFFKTGEGEYGAGDKFLGIRVPVLRKLARSHREIVVPEILKLLHSQTHEVRLLALILLVQKYERGDEPQKQEVFDLYCRNLDHVNNWDLVDASAHKIIGPHLLNRDRTLLRKLSSSDDLWRRRVAIISTYAFIRVHDFDDTLELATQLLEDPEDLIHKAVGWMLREVGNRDRDLEEHFLKVHYQSMPRTMLRYAIEKLPKARRQDYLQGRA